MLNVPPSAASELARSHFFVGNPSQVVVLPAGIVIFGGELMVRPVGSFFSSAAASTKILKVDPA